MKHYPNPRACRKALRQRKRPKNQKRNRTNHIHSLILVCLGLNKEEIEEGIRAAMNQNWQRKLGIERKYWSKDPTKIMGLIKHRLMADGSYRRLKDKVLWVINHKLRRLERHKEKRSNTLTHYRINLKETA